MLSTISAPDARLLVITPYDKGALGAIEKAILKSDLGLTPSNDGKIVRIAIPPLTEQRRKELVKVVHKISEEYKVSVRNLRRDANELIKDIKKDGKISEDDAFKSQEKIQKITDDSIKLVDECYKEKEKEILEF
jgi:ribosome recycling factor